MGRWRSGCISFEHNKEDTDESSSMDEFGLVSPIVRTDFYLSSAHVLIWYFYFFNLIFIGFFSITI